MSNDENKFQPIFQILHIKSAWFLLELVMALVTTIGMRFLQVWTKYLLAISVFMLLLQPKEKSKGCFYFFLNFWQQHKSKKWNLEFSNGF